MTYFEKAQKASTYISSRIDSYPEIAIVLGTGLGNLKNHIENPVTIPFEEIPHFPKATVAGHEGALVAGNLGNKKVIAQAGRFHYYEGYSMKEVTLPIRVFKLLGIETVFIASATGGIHEDLEAGDVAIVEDHINLHHENPLRGTNDERFGPRFPDMVDAYTPGLIQLALRVAKEKKVKLHTCVYAGIPGPNIETKAEYNYLHIIGATVVGMSTVPEVIIAKQMGMKTCVFAAITNKCYPISAIKKVTHEEVISVAKRIEENLTVIVREMIYRM